MPTSLEHLLPGADESIRCAEFARGIDLDPGGTAMRADIVVLAEVALPWPKPALAHPMVVELAEQTARHPDPVRLLLTVPTSAPGPNRVIVYERTADGAIESQLRFGTVEDGIEIGQGLLDGTLATHRLLLDRGEASGRSVLICTQGSHDICCGAEGERLAGELDAMITAENEEWPDLQVFRVSHTGGHRFAPTAMTLPDGRMWAGLDAAAMLAIVDGTADPVAIHSRCRGWWGADTGPAQVAERAVFGEVGWSLDGQARTATIVRSEVRGGVSSGATGGAEERANCEVRSATDTWDVVVERARIVPTVACRQPGGQPVKQGTEYAVRSLNKR